MFAIEQQIFLLSKLFQLEAAPMVFPLFLSLWDGRG